MAQDIKFQDVVVDLMEIEVCRLPVCKRIVGRILHRGKIMDVHVQRNDDDAAGVLTGRSFDPFTQLGQVDALRIAHGAFDAHRLFIALDVTNGRLCLYRTDRTGPEDMFISKHFFCIRMGPRLIITGEVQVDIRHLVALKAQERLKGNVLPVSAHDRSALRTSLVRKVKSVEHAAIRIEMRVLAVWTHIVRRQRIDLGDLGHRRDEAGSHRSPAADQISVIQALFYQQV